MSIKPVVSIYGDISVDDIVKALEQVYPDRKLRINDERNKDNALVHPNKIGMYSILLLTLFTLFTLLLKLLLLLLL